MMKKNITPALLLLAALCAACSSDNVVAEVPQPTEPETVTTPVTIRASYGDGTTAPASSGDGATRTAYSESGNTISATWEEDDEILVIFDGHVNILTLTDGAGTASATFSGSILGSPKSGSLLACYVRDKNNPGALTVDDGDLIYSDAAFLTQDGTLAGAARCNTYSGSTTYGNGTDLHVAFSVNTSMLKFTVLNPFDLYMAEGTKDVTLTYKSGQTVLARAAFSFGSEAANTVYMSVPAGLFTGEQTLVYKTGVIEVSRTLSASQADFKPGQTYSREVDFDNSTKLDNIRYNYTASNGEVLAGKLLNYYTLYIADGATVTFRGINAIVSLQGNGTIILEAGTTNSVKGISNSPGIYVPSGKTLTIRGSGSLEASAYDYAAGIGAGKNASCGDIVIEGGNITATGGEHCAGIGSGYNNSSCGDITINGGTVTATGGSEGAGIGSGNDTSSCGNITITGGTVSATGGVLAAGIGSGYFYCSCGNITFTGGTVNATGGPKGAGIGSGSNSSSCSSITISGGTVTATKGLDAPYSIGSGYNSTCGTITIGRYPVQNISTSPYIFPIP